MAGVEDGCEHEPDVVALDGRLDRRGLGVDLHADLFEDVRTPGGRGDRVVAVLGDGDARPRGDDRTRRRDVDRVVVVPARPAGVDQRSPVGVDRPCGLAHPLSEAGDFGLCLALGAEGAEEGPDLGLRGLREDETRCLAGFCLGEVLPIGDAFDVRLHAHCLSPMVVSAL